MRVFPGLMLLCLLGAAPAVAAEPPLAALTLVGPPQTIFDTKKDACDGNDQPDAPLRLFRDAEGKLAGFGLHYVNRALRGDTLAGLKIDCRVVLASGSRGDPAAYDDKSWITATWTDDGQRVAALVHHEFQAQAHPGRCRFPDYMRCWFNTVLQVGSSDGGANFPRPKVPQVVASAPFGQETGQGRHRGFFNPSNIVADGRHRYVFAATTGWYGQPSGACLLRSDDPFDPASWRAFDGAGFTIRYPDPYRTKDAKVAPCRTIEPFPAPVGSVTRHRATGAWIAVFQASAEGERFPKAGFYVTSSRDLLTWDTPRLLLAGQTLYDDPCRSGGRLIAYPSLIDEEAQGRNFDDVGDQAWLTFTTLAVEGCRITADRVLLRRRVAVKVWP